MSNQEIEACSCFEIGDLDGYHLRPCDEQKQTEEGSIKDLQKAYLERRERKASGPTRRYINLNWIPSTTCEVERLFSKCRHVFSLWRKAMTPLNLEALLYLKVNRRWWDHNTVANVMSHYGNRRSEGEEHATAANSAQIIAELEEEYADADS